jgi:hypothetical protein
LTLKMYAGRVTGCGEGKTDCTAWWYVRKT